MKLLVSLVCLNLVRLLLCSPLIWPLPKELNSTDSSNSLHFFPKNFTFNIMNPQSLNAGLKSYLKEILQKYYQLIFQSDRIARYYDSGSLYDFSYQRLNASEFLFTENRDCFFNVSIKNSSQLTLGYNISEQYSLDLSENERTISADNYFGFVHALQTLSQLIQCSQVDAFHQQCSLSSLPLSMRDSPDFMHRGVMLDPSRHFLPLGDLLRTIDGLSYGKLNTLHLHFTDSNSFSTWVNDYPEITKFGAFYFSEYYSVEELELLIQHGTLMGVRVIPEYDSPGHTRAWGLSPNLKEMIACQGLNWQGHAVQPPCGQLDPLLNQTYDLVRSIAKQCNGLFPDEVMHWGGDEVNQGCWDAKDTIRKAISEQGVYDIEQDFVQRQRQILKEVNATKRAMYWVQGPIWKNEGDILQHWGGSNQLNGFLEFKDQYLVVSSVDTLYMDCGLGNLFGGESWCGSYKDFLTILNTNFQVKPELQYIVLGGEACMWLISPTIILLSLIIRGELVNSGSLDNKLWGRLSALSEKLWNHGYYNEDSRRLKEMRSIIPRLAKFEEMLMQRGIAVTPVTTDFCAENVEVCF